MRKFIKTSFNYQFNIGETYPYVIVLIIFFLPLYPKLSNLFIGLLIILWLSENQWKWKIEQIKHSFGFLLLTIFLFLFCLGIISTDNILAELKQIEKRLSLVFIPLILLSSKHFNNSYKKSLWKYYGAFVLTTNVLTSYTFYQVFNILITSGEIPVVGSEVSDMTLIHRPYLAYFSLISSTICFYHLVYFRSSLKKKLFYILSYLLCIGVIIVLVARSAIAILVVVHIYILFKIIVKERKTFILFSIISSIICIISVIGLLNYDRFTSRFELLLQGKEEPRILIWNCSYKIIKSVDFNVLIGLGSNNETQNQLNECYKNEFLNRSYWGWVYEHGYNFNTHNEFINLFITFGLVGLTVFVSLLFFLFVKSWRLENIIFQSFIIIFTLCCLTENFMARQNGIVPFSIFAALIIAEYNQNKLADSKQKS